MVEQLNIYGAYLEAKDRAELRKGRERKMMRSTGKAWGIYNSSIEDYEGYFKSFLEMSFRSFIDQRRVQKGKVFCLDVMGTLRFSDYSEVDGEAAMTLLDFRTEEEKSLDANQNRSVFAGNLVKHQPWDEAERFIQTHDDTAFQGFDLITCRPVSGWNTIRGNVYKDSPETDVLEWVVYQRMANLLSPHGGTMTVQPSGFHDNQEWFEAIRRDPHIGLLTPRGGFTRGSFGIVRKDKAPVLLPQLLH